MIALIVALVADGIYANEVKVSGDAILAPLTDKPGSVSAGRKVFVDRQLGHCLLCHVVSSIDEPFQGNLGPALSAGSSLSDGQIRLRLVDSSQVNPDSVMPSYFRIDGLQQVGAEYQGKPALSAQQIEDLIAFLRSLSTGDLGDSNMVGQPGRPGISRETSGTGR